MPPKYFKLDQAPDKFRAPVARGLATGSRVESAGGEKKSGFIPGVSFITKGEALGHGYWIDEVFLQQVADACAADPKGKKSRFTHPSLSGDGMGKYLGRAKGGVLDGICVRGDLHLSPLSRKSPDGDLGGYVMELADDDPEAFGASIVFLHDYAAEKEFLVANGAEYDEEYGWYGFTSPDPENVMHLPHARLSELHAVDVVDDPAANPNGLFYRGQEIPQGADELLSYGLGLSEQKPAQSVFNVDPDRVAGFLGRFLDRHNLSLVSKEGEAMPPIANALKKGSKLSEATTDPEKKEEETPAGETSASDTEKNGEESTAAEGEEGDEIDPPEGGEGKGADPVPSEKPKEGEEEEGALTGAKRYQKAFGRELGSIYFADGLSFEDASAEFSKAQAKANEALSAENKTLKDQLEAAKGEGTPVGFDGGGKSGAGSKNTKVLGSKLAAFADSIKLPK